MINAKPIFWCWRLDLGESRADAVKIESWGDHEQAALVYAAQMSVSDPDFPRAYLQGGGVVCVEMPASTEARHVRVRARISVDWSAETVEGVSA